MARATNLRSRGSAHLFRRKIPPRLVARFGGKVEMALSLGTRDPGEARRRARLAWLRCQVVFDIVEQRPLLTPTQIATLVLQLRNAWDERAEIRFANGDGLLDVGPGAPEADIASAIADTYREALASNDLGIVDGLMDDRLRAAIPGRPGGITEKLVRRALMRAVVEHTERALRHNEGRYEPLARDVANGTPTFVTEARMDASVTETPSVTPCVEAAQATSTSPWVAPPHLIRFSEHWDKFVGAMLREKRWTKHTATQATASKDLFIQIITDLPLAALSRAHVSDFRILLTRLPRDYAKARRWRDWAPGDIADAAEGDHSETYLAPKTVARHLTALATYWNWLVTNGRGLTRASENIFLGFRMKKKSLIEVKRERSMWTPNQLRKLFTSPVWAGCRSKSRRAIKGPEIIRDHRFWVPLIGAYSLMRLEEICQLYVGDVFQASDADESLNDQKAIWAFKISLGDDQQLKNEASHRLVPIHKNLLNLGILDLVRNRRKDERLFPELKPGGPDNKRGFYVSKWFTAYRRQIGCDDPKLVFHSLRHSGTTLLINAKVPESWVDEISGHEGDERRSESRRYTKMILLENLKDSIDKIDLGVDLSHLFL